MRSPGPRTVILRASPAGDTMVNRVVSSSEEEDRSMGCEDEPIVAGGGIQAREARVLLQAYCPLMDDCNNQQSSSVSKIKGCPRSIEGFIPLGISGT